MSKPANAATALVAVIDALEPLDDKDRQWILHSAASRWSIPVSPALARPSDPAASSGGVYPAPNAVAPAAIGDVRSFMRAKNPTSDIQRVACLGYFHMKTAGTQGFASKDLEKIRTESGTPKFNIARAIDNATRRSKYLASGSGREKLLTPLGEDIVEALPDQQKVGTIEQSAKQAVRGRAKAKSKVKRAKK